MRARACMLCVGRKELIVMSSIILGRGVVGDFNVIEIIQVGKLSKLVF